MSVEARRPPGSIGRSAMHQSWRPVAVATLNPASPEDAIALVLKRIRSTQSARGCGCYLFIDEELLVFVIPEEKSVAMEWVKTRFRTLVGFYTTRHRGARDPWLAPTVDGLVEDIAGHLDDMRRLR